jgi:hypothetical protein
MHGGVAAPPVDLTDRVGRHDIGTDAWAKVFEAAEKGHHLESDLAQPRVHSVTWLVPWRGWHVCIHCSARLAAPTDVAYQRRTEMAMAA